MITLRRDCQAIRIPSGERVTVAAGTAVTVTQSLGGMYTVLTDEGAMVRIAGDDADALGLEAPAAPQAATSAPADGPNVERLVWAQLRTIFDPEIPVNIVDLGLVYGCRAIPWPVGGHMVEVQMTLTAPGCGMGDVLKADAERKIKGLPGVTVVEVEVVFDPPWNQSMMSEAARLQTGMF